MTTKNTKIINMMGAPSSGKTVMAHGLMSKMKIGGYDVEYVSEVAKDLVWSGDEQALSNQLYVAGRQLQRIERLMGKVEYIITDSPFFLSIFYAPDTYPASFEKCILDLFWTYENINFYIVNNRGDHEDNGRVHDEEESVKISMDILWTMHDEDIPYTRVNGDNEGLEKIYSEIERLSSQ